MARKSRYKIPKPMWTCPHCGVRPYGSRSPAPRLKPVSVQELRQTVPERSGRQPRLMEWPHPIKQGDRRISAACAGLVVYAFPQFSTVSRTLEPASNGRRRI